MIGATTLHGLLGGKDSDSLGYGYLYNWYTASDVNFAPTDWVVPTYTECTTLINYIGSTNGGDVKFPGFEYWDSPNTGADNSSGLSLLGNGQRFSSGAFNGLKLSSTFWIYASASRVRAYYSSETFQITGASNNYGWGVRLLYTGTGTPTSVTDNDGNVYDVVLIGTQYWTVQNWKCTTLNNGTAIPNVTDGTTWAGLTTGARCAYDNEESNV